MLFNCDTICPIGSINDKPFYTVSEKSNLQGHSAAGNATKKKSGSQRTQKIPLDLSHRCPWFQR